MEDFKINVFYDKEKPNVEVTMYNVYREYLKNKLIWFANLKEIRYTDFDKELSFVKVEEEI